MKSVLIKSNQKASGYARVYGAKNAILPIMAASILSDEKSMIQNVPNLSDVSKMTEILSHLSVVTKNHDGKIMHINTKNIKYASIESGPVSQIRGSLFFLGSMIAKFKRAKIALPGGCNLNKSGRPVDLHIDGLLALGVDIKIENNTIVANGGVKGGHYKFKKVSVGATENLIMAATICDGVSTIENAAREPEVSDLIHYLNSKGAKIKGVGTSKIVIQGVKKLSDDNVPYKIICDRIAAITYAMIIIATRGEGCVYCDDLMDIAEYEIEVLKKIGIKIDVDAKKMKIDARDGIKNTIDIATGPFFSGFATDLQQQYVSLMSTANGNLIVSENIYDNRFMHVPYLNTMGAKIKINGNKAHINGTGQLLEGGEFNLHERSLRESAAMVIAGLSAKRDTILHEVTNIQRGYEDFYNNMMHLGLKLERVNAC